MLFQFKYFFYILGLFLLLKSSYAEVVSLSMCDADCPMQPNEGCHRTCSSEYDTCQKKCDTDYFDKGDLAGSLRCTGECNSGMKMCATKCPQIMNYEDLVIKTVHAIVGGKEVSALGEYPFIVSVLSQTWEGNRLKCGGVLLSPNKVITSARCVDGETASKLTIRCGSLNRDEMPRTSPVSSIKIPDSFYNEGAVTPFLYDVAVLTLSISIAETDSIKYIPALPTTEPSFNEDGSDSAMVSFAGWGRTSKDDSGLSTMLQSIELPLSSQCTTSTTSTTNSTIIQRCIDGNGKGACVGDEGGPVMYNNQLVGILSQGSCGASDVQNVYTSTIAVRDFLISS